LGQEVCTLRFGRREFREPKRGHGMRLRWRNDDFAWMGMCKVRE
jgi:hypothetical protein